MVERRGETYRSRMVKTKFRILEVLYISHVFFKFLTIRKWQQFRKNNRNLALTGVRTDCVHINQISIAKITNFSLDTSANVV